MERSWRTELHAQIHLGQKERISVRDAVVQFIDTKKGTANHVNLMNGLRVLDRLFRMNRHLDEVGPEDLERLKRDRVQEGASPATVKHTFNLVRGAWKHARRMGYYTTELVFPAIKLPKHRLRYLTSDEERRLLAELEPRRVVHGLAPYGQRTAATRRQMHDAYDLVVCLLDTGARYTEIAGLEWSSLDLNDRVIRLWRPKVQNESILFMTDRVHRLLTRRASETVSRYVFTNNSGEKRGYSSMAIRKAFRRAGLDDCTIHTLRHTHASRLIQNGMNIYEVKEILGHADIKTTMRYAHLERRDVSSRARDVINQLNKETQKPDLKVV